ncbi:MAG: response regulator [Bacteroidales bacterium]|nr:response regulator [Bacteroidales bacterium]
MKNNQIFIIDDSNTNLLLLEDILMEEGYEVKTDDNPKRALQKIKENPPDLILLDLLMPGLDGFQFLDKLEPRNIPIIIISADRNAESIKKAKAKGIYDYIMKPINVKHIKDKVKEAILYNKNLKAFAYGNNN